MKMQSTMKGGFNVKINIRRGCFETNSSSMHSVCIGEGDLNDLVEKIDFYTGEYGWEHEVLTTTKEKASYLFQQFLYFHDDSSANAKFEKLKELLDSCGIKYDFHYDVGGYIDHDSASMEFIDAIIADADSLLQYLFGDSIVVLGNDNDDWHLEYMANLDKSKYAKIIE